MEVRELSGETWISFEVSADCDSFTADVLNKIRKVIDRQYPTWLLHSITMHAHPTYEDKFLYTVVLHC